MTIHLPPELRLQVSQRRETAGGLHLPQERLSERDRKICLAARTLAFFDTIAFTPWILASPSTDDHIRMLAKRPYAEKTYFFRDPLV